MWLLTNFQYLWLAAAFAVSKPFRQPQWTNVPFSLLWAALLSFSVVLLFTESPGLLGFLQLIDLPDFNFRWCIATLALLSGLASASLVRLSREGGRGSAAELGGQIERVM